MTHGTGDGVHGQNCSMVSTYSLRGADDAGWEDSVAKGVSYAALGYSGETASSLILEK